MDARLGTNDRPTSNLARTLLERRRPCHLASIVNAVAEAALTIGQEASSENALVEGLERLPSIRLRGDLWATGELADTTSRPRAC
jgi:hypothetical protein